MRIILTAILLFTLIGAASAQTIYDIEKASLSWQHVWVENGEWIDPDWTFPLSVINCNRTFPNAVRHDVAGPTLQSPFLDFIAEPGNYTCDITIIHKSGNETDPSPTVTFTASWPELGATDLEIIIGQ